MKPVPVVMVLPTFLPESFGGAEQQARKLAGALAQLGIGVTVLAPRLSAQTPKMERHELFAVRRFRLAHAPNLGGRHLFSFLIWAWKLSIWLILHRREYGVIHIFHGRLHALPAVLTAWCLGKPSLVKIGRGGRNHFDLDILKRKRISGRWYAEAVCRYATAYVANSREIVGDLQRWGVRPHRIHEIPNGVDIPDLDPLPAFAVGEEAKPTLRLISLGRLDPEKCIDIMLRGFARFTSNDSVSLTIVGDGVCRRELEQLSEDLQLKGRVRFTGAVSDVRALLREADVYVSTSTSEGMSNALLEAMSHGLVPLVSRVSGVGDIVADDSSGLLFEPDDLDSFADRLGAVISLPEDVRRTLGAQARATVATRFGIDQVARAHKTLYEELLRSAA